MKKTFLVLAAAFAVAMPAAAEAQATAGDLGGSKICTLTDIVGYTMSRCSGFWDKNIVNKEAGELPTGTMASVLTGWGYTVSNIIEKKNFKDTETPIFSNLMYGKTVVAFHWGNHPVGGNSSVIYEFDAGNTGISTFEFAQSKGLSNGAILYTSGRVDCVPGECCLGQGDNCNPVPEPNSYLLMASGLAGLGYLARRRRTQA